MNGRRKWMVFGTAAILSLLLVIRLGRAFFSQPEADLITWDQAARAEEAVLLAKEVRFLEVRDFAVHILSLNWWPPLYPLIMLPFCLILGPNLEAAILPSLIFFIVAIIGILYAYDNLLPHPLEDKIAGFAFLFSLAATSPLLLSSATWAMLEVFGIALTFFAFGAYFRGRQTGGVESYRTCAVLSVLLWTLKYSYGLLFSVTLLIFEAARVWPRLRHGPLPLPGMVRRLLKPVFYPVYGLVAVLSWVLLFGGGAMRVFGLKTSITNVYNPLMYLYLYSLVVILFKTGRRWPAIKSRLEPGQRELLLWGALPAAAFMALPDKIKALVMNLQAGNRAKPPSIFDAAPFYLRAFFRDYSLFVPVGILVLGLLALAILKFKKVPLGVTVLGVYFVLGAFSLTAGFGLRESRYLATFVPALWVGAAWSAGFLVSRFERPIKLALAGAVLVSTLILIFLTPIPVKKAIRQPWAPWAHQEGAVRFTVEDIIRMTQGTRHMTVLGVREAGFGPLLGWKLQAAHFRKKDFEASLDAPFPDDKSTPEFRKMTAAKRMDLIILCIVNKGKSSSLLRRWSRILKDSGSYGIARKARYDAPVPLRVFFFYLGGAPNQNAYIKHPLEVSRLER